MGPDEQQIREQVVPALLDALRDEGSNDVLSGALIALAKIGDPSGAAAPVSLACTFEAFLADASQQVAESAALALGILAEPASVETLIHLARDDERGRELACRAEVPERTRAFAAYGLGLVGARTSMPALRHWTVRALVGLLEGARGASTEPEAAAVIALGLVPLEPMPPGRVDRAGKAAFEPAFVRWREDQVAYLLALLADERGRRPRVRAHAPRALAHLVEQPVGNGAGEMRDAVVGALVATLRPQAGEPAEVRQACAQALGLLGSAGASDGDLRAALIGQVQRGDELSRRFALISLARCAARCGPDGDRTGYSEVRQQLLTWLERSGRGMTRLRPWLAIALGVLERGRIARDEAPHYDVIRALRIVLADGGSPQEAGAYCLAAGLLGDRGAAPLVTAELERLADDGGRGFAALSLGLMNERGARERLRDLVAEAGHRQALLEQACIALALLGDKDLVSQLCALLTEAQSLPAQAAVALALGRIGDARAVDPLVAMLRDRSITASARGFAAVALGDVADKELMPWSAKIAADVHYGAGTATLSDAQGAGILDIL
jgi:HEAT repeat protein